jgi:uncharacterized protein YecA (UPF0149 family)
MDEKTSSFASLKTGSDSDFSQPKNQLTEEARVKPRDATGRKIGRNDPCPCGSGKKYKKCCGR